MGIECSLSFIIPCYRSENTIREVVNEIDTTMLKRKDLSYEIILVNDGSPDQVWNVIRSLTNESGYITGISLSRNFGQHCALMAGYRNAAGSIVVSLDDDGQSPVNEVFQLIEQLDDDYDVVYATYPVYRQSIFRRWGSAFANKMTHYMFDMKDDLPKQSSFFVMKHYVVEEILRYDHAFPYITGLIFRTTRKIKMIPLPHRDRIYGKSGYNLKSLVSLWLNGFTAFSVKPLEFGAYIGFLFSILGFVFALITIVRKLVDPSIQTGWSSMISAVMIIGGVIMLMLGLIGEYIGRIYLCINHSPQYVIREIIKKDID